MKLLLTSLSILFLSISCGEDKKTDESFNWSTFSSKGRFTSDSGHDVLYIIDSSSFSASEGVEEVPKEDVQGTLDYNYNLYVDAAGAASSINDADSSCKIERETAGLTANGEKGYLMAGFDVNYADCLPGDNGLKSYTRKEVRFLSCTDVDFSSFTNSYEAYTDALNAYTCASGEVFNQIIKNDSYTYEGGSSTSTYEYIEADASGKTCSMNYLSGGEKEYFEDCIEESAEVTSDTVGSDTTTVKRYFKLTFKKGLVIPKAGDVPQWFKAGTVVYEFANWTATITYTNETTPPTYTATNGTETVTGQLTAK